MCFGKRVDEGLEALGSQLHVCWKKTHLIVRRRVQQRASKQIQQTGSKTEQCASESEGGCAELSVLVSVIFKW
jgi:hypothetical protein